jgi:hypothetical protein
VLVFYFGLNSILVVLFHVVLLIRGGCQWSKFGGANDFVTIAHEETEKRGIAEQVNAIWHCIRPSEMRFDTVLLNLRFDTVF